MSFEIKNVLVIGAGGHLGSSILPRFEEDPHFTVSVLARRSSKSDFSSRVKVHRIADDYPEAELLEAFRGQDAVISVIARANLDQQKVIINAAAKAGVKRFIPSEFGGDTENQKAVELLSGYLGPKVEVLNYLKGKEKDGLTWTAFVTGPFFDLGMKLGYACYDLKQHKATILNDGNSMWSTTTMSTAALAVKNAMLVPEKTANKTLYIDSFTVSQNQVLASVEKATGKKWGVTHVNAEEQKKTGQEKMAEGDPSGFPLLIQYVNYVEGYGGNYAQTRETANDLLRLPKESLDEIVADLVKT